MYQDNKQQMNRIAIIGSGITGMSVAFQQSPKTDVTIFDKSRKPGGRVSTRTSRQHPGYAFDHGVPFVTVKGQFMDYLKKINAVREDRLQVLDFNMGKNGKTSETTLLSGNPSIETIPTKLLAELAKQTNLHIEYDTKITEIQTREKYFLRSQQVREYGPFDQIYVCIPYPQCKTIKQSLVKFPQENTEKREYNCSWVIMIALDAHSTVSQKFKGIDIVKNLGEGIASMINQRTKGNTSEDDLWVVTMEEKWCQENINMTPETVEQKLKQKMSNLFGEGIEYKFIKAHRWLYSQPNDTPSQPIIGKNIVFGADWLNKRSNIQECWELGPLLHKIMNEKASHL